MPTTLFGKGGRRYSMQNKRNGTHNWAFTWLPALLKKTETVPLVPPELQRPRKQQECHLTNPHRSMQEHRNTAFAKTGFPPPNVTLHSLLPNSVHFCPCYPGKPMSSRGQRTRPSSSLALLQSWGRRGGRERGWQVSAIWFHHPSTDNAGLRTLPTSNSLCSHPTFNSLSKITYKPEIRAQAKKFSSERLPWLWLGSWGAGLAEAGSIGDHDTHHVPSVQATGSGSAWVGGCSVERTDHQRKGTRKAAPSSFPLFWGGAFLSPSG